METIKASPAFTITVEDDGLLVVTHIATGDSLMFDPDKIRGLSLHPERVMEQLRGVLKRGDDGE